MSTKRNKLMERLAKAEKLKRLQKSIKTQSRFVLWEQAVHYKLNYKPQIKAGRSYQRNLAMSPLMIAAMLGVAMPRRK